MLSHASPPGPTAQRGSVRLFIDPPSHHFTKDRLFENSAARYGGDDLMAPHRAVRDGLTAAGVPTHTLDLMPPEPDGHLDLVVSIGAGLRPDQFRRLSERPQTILSAYMPFECPIVAPSLYRRIPEMKRLFRRVLSWGDPNALMPFVGERVALEPFHWPQSFDEVHEDLWSRRNRRFLMMMNSNKFPRVRTNELYSERLRAVEFFDRYGEIDLYGRFWDRAPIKVGETMMPGTVRRIADRVHRVAWKLRQRVAPDPLVTAAVRANRGAADSKSHILSQYDFSICFENMALKGWITEKMFDCFFTGTIPIYLGAPEIREKVPAECFIDMRDFRDYEELRGHLHALTPAQRDGYREAARDFLRSPGFDPFRKSTFVELFRGLVAADSGVRV